MNRTKRMAKELQPRQKHYEADVKFRILHLFERGSMPPEEIAESFGVSERTLYNWRNAYDRLGMAGLEDSPKSGRPPLVSRDEIKAAAEAVRGRGMATVKDVRGQISKTCGIRYSSGHVRDIPDRMEMTYKKADPMHRRAATNAEIEEWAAASMPAIREHPSKGYVLLSVDEVHPEIDGASRYGYAERGQRVYATHHGTKRRLNSRGRGKQGPFHVPHPEEVELGDIRQVPRGSAREIPQGRRPAGRGHLPHPQGGQEMAAGPSRNSPGMPARGIPPT